MTNQIHTKSIMYINKLNKKHPIMYLKLINEQSKLYKYLNNSKIDKKHLIILLNLNFKIKS